MKVAKHPNRQTLSLQPGKKPASRALTDTAGTTPREFAPRHQLPPPPLSQQHQQFQQQSQHRQQSQQPQYHQQPRQHRQSHHQLLLPEQRHAASAPVPSGTWDAEAPATRFFGTAHPGTADRAPPPPTALAAGPRLWPRHHSPFANALRRLSGSPSPAAAATTTATPGERAGGSPPSGWGEQGASATAKSSPQRNGRGTADRRPAVPPRNPLRQQARGAAAEEAAQLPQGHGSPWRGKDPQQQQQQHQNHHVAPLGGRPPPPGLLPRMLLPPDHPDALRGPPVGRSGS